MKDYEIAVVVYENRMSGDISTSVLPDHGCMVYRWPQQQRKRRIDYKSYSPTVFGISEPQTKQLFPSCIRFQFHCDDSQSMQLSPGIQQITDVRVGEPVS